MLKHDYEKWNKKETELSENKKIHDCECDHDVEHDCGYEQEEHDCTCGC